MRATDSERHDSLAARGSAAQRRAEIVAPLAVATLVVLMTALVFAVVPTFEPGTAAGVGLAALLCGATLWLAREKRAIAASACYVVVALLLRTSPVLGGLGGAHTDVFTAGQLYYVVLSAVPIFAAALLLDLPWSLAISGLIVAFDQFGIWALPHDASFERFVGLVGGSAGLALNLALVEGCMLTLGLAVARAIDRAERDADHCAVRAAHYAREREAIVSDIEALRVAHGRMAHGEPLPVVLPPTSPLYPVAVSLVLLDDRLRELNNASRELGHVDRGLHETALALSRMARGDFMTMPLLTGSLVDPTIVAIGHLQGQFATWQRDMAQRLGALSTSHDQIGTLAADLMRTVSYLDRAIGEAQRHPAFGLMEVRQAAIVARHQVERMAQVLAQAALQPMTGDIAPSRAPAPPMPPATPARQRGEVRLPAA